MISYAPAHAPLARTRPDESTSAAQPVIAELQGVLIGMEAIDPSCCASSTESCTWVKSGTLTAEGWLTWTPGRVTFGFASGRLHAPNHFSITGLAWSGVMSPMTAMVVMSGRNTFA